MRRGRSLAGRLLAVTRRCLSAAVGDHLVAQARPARSLLKPLPQALECRATPRIPPREGILDPAALAHEPDSSSSMPPNPPGCGAIPRGREFPECRRCDGG